MDSIIASLVNGKVCTSDNPRAARALEITRMRFCDHVSEACLGRGGSNEGIAS